MSRGKCSWPLGRCPTILWFCSVAPKYFVIFRNIFWALSDSSPALRSAGKVSRSILGRVRLHSSSAQRRQSRSSHLGIMASVLRQRLKTPNFDGPSPAQKCQLSTADFSKRVLRSLSSNSRRLRMDHVLSLAEMTQDNVWLL